MDNDYWHRNWAKQLDGQFSTLKISIATANTMEKSYIIIYLYIWIGFVLFFISDHY